MDNEVFRQIGERGPAIRAARLHRSFGDLVLSTG